MSNCSATKSRRGVPTTLLSGDWERCWHDILDAVARQGFRRLHLTDLDDTKYEDALVRANEALGLYDFTLGQKRWHLYRQAHDLSSGVRILPQTEIPPGAELLGDRLRMNNAVHMDAQVRDLISVMRSLHPEQDPMDKLSEWICANVGLIQGADSFVSSLAAAGVATVGITNGVWQVAEALLAHHGLNMPFMANYVQDGRFCPVHNDHLCLDKAALVRLAHARGFHIVSCAGDSLGDVGMCAATAALGGLVIVRGVQGGLAHWAVTNLRPDQWLLVDHYEDDHSIQSRILARGT